jgi:nicotinate phosphoribosyltransferase
VLALADEPLPGGAESLLETVMRDGELRRPNPPLAEVRRHCLAQLAALPDGLRRLRGQAEYPVRVSTGLRARQDRAMARVRG